MNRINLLRQIYQGKWFIHYSYALGLAPVLQNILTKSATERDWHGMQTQELDNEGRAKLPLRVAVEDEIFEIPDFSEAEQGSVAIIPLKGAMIKYGDICQYGTTEVAEAILQATANERITGILLDIDSGGGSVDSIKPLTQAIEKARAAGKPVVAAADLCASAAYMVASYCNRIVALNDFSAEFGSIGVMMQFWDIVPFYEKDGYKFHTIYAPESNYKNLPLEKALKGDYKLIQEEELSPLAVAFQNTVKENRGKKLNLKVEGLLNGRMFYARNQHNKDLSAKAVGLIDAVADMDYAINMVLSIADSLKYLNNI